MLVKLKWIEALISDLNNNLQTHEENVHVFRCQEDMTHEQMCVDMCVIKWRIYNPTVHSYKPTCHLCHMVYWNRPWVVLLVAGIFKCLIVKYNAHKRISWNFIKMYKLILKAGERCVCYLFSIAAVFGHHFSKRLQNLYAQTLLILF